MFPDLFCSINYMKSMRALLFALLFSFFLTAHGSAQNAPPAAAEPIGDRVEDTPKSYLQIISGAACGPNGYYQMLRNSHSSRTIHATIIVVLAPGGRMPDIDISIAPEKIVFLGCSVSQSSSGDSTSKVTYAVNSAKFK